MYEGTYGPVQNGQIKWFPIILFMNINCTFSFNFNFCVLSCELSLVL